MGLDPSHEMTERDMNESQLPEHIGDKWRDLARALKYSQAVIDVIQKEQGNSTKDCCIAVLVRWMCREGRDATVGKLAEALTKIKLKSVADRLIGMLKQQILRGVAQKRSIFCIQKLRGDWALAFRQGFLGSFVCWRKPYTSVHISNKTRNTCSSYNYLI